LGHVTLTSSGGLPPYINSWSNLQFGNEQYLAAGTYSVTTTDQGGATVIHNFEIIEPALFAATLTGNDINCNGGTTAIDVLLSGGTLPYNSFDPISVSAPGLYTYTFTDANNCTTSPSIQINALDAFTVFANTYNPSCYDACNGYVQLTINNGVEPFTSTWSNGGDGSNLCAGSYDVQIQDATGCTQSFNFLLENPDSVYAVSTLQEPTCNGNLDGNIFVQPYGGIGNYTFTWNGDPLSNLNSIIYLTAGNYYLDLMDGNGCVAHYDYVLNEPTPLSYTIDSFVESGLGVGEVQMSTTGGTPPYFFQWSSGQNEEDPTLPLNSTNYCTITDANGCSITTTNLTTFDVVVELSENNLLVYPNPANNQLKLISDNAIDQLLVVSNYGELVSKYQQQGTTAVIETELLSNGIYSLRVYSGGQWSTIKFAVQH
jgi:hypothetical protein